MPVGQPIPRTHNLEALQQFCLTFVPALQLTDVDLAELTPYAVQLRYDFEFWPDQETAGRCISLSVYVLLPFPLFPRRPTHEHTVLPPVQP